MTVYNFRAPALPLPAANYDRDQQDQFQSALRLYFSRLDNYNAAASIQVATIEGDITTIEGDITTIEGDITTIEGDITIINGEIDDLQAQIHPFIAASDSAIQYATASNTPTIVNWTSLDSGFGFTLNPGNTATALYAGYYKITYSLQFANNDNAAHDSIVWLRLNGNTSAADVVGSTTIFTVPARKSAIEPAFVCGYSEVVFQMNVGDTVGLWWGTNQAASSGGATGAYINYRTAQTTPMPYPETPSAIGSITFVSGLY
jgi:hypothetical protein